jgi:tRNA dimethylallyltransferase
VFGPTGLGKTEVALTLAERLRGEVVSADSMQVYRGLPILTNQPTPAQLARARHHLVAVVDPDAEFSVAAYARLAAPVFDELAHRRCAAVIEGGSGLYLRAALGGLSFGPPPAAVRDELEALAARDPRALVARLERLDPRAALRVDLDNPRRVVRALEKALAETRRADQSSAPDRGPGSLLWSAGRRGARLVALEPDRERLRERVDARVEEMFAGGLVDEVRTVRGGYDLSRTVRQAIGVAEVCAYLDGELTLEEARRRMQARTRAYVRRQLTWMRKLPDAARIRVSARPADDVAGEIIERLF